jgi:hypothetical protein
VLVDLLEDVLPELVHRGAQPCPALLTRAAEEGVRAEAEGGHLRAGHQLGDRLEVAVLVVLVVAGVAAVGQPADDVQDGGQLVHRPPVGALRDDVVDAVQVVAVVLVRREVGRSEAGDDRPHRVVGQVVVGVHPAEGRQQGR